MPSFPLASPVGVQSYQRMQSQEQQDRLERANNLIQELQRQLNASNQKATYWERKAKYFEALAEERAPKPIAATTPFQNPGNSSADEASILSSKNLLRITGSGVMGPTWGPQEAQITRKRRSFPPSDQLTIDLTAGDNSEAASSSPGSSDPAISKPSSQSSKSGSSSVDNAAGKEYEWLPGGHPMKSRKRPRPFGSEQSDEQPDNTPLFGSFMSTANGRKTYSEVELDGSRRKMQRPAWPQTPKAASRSKAPTRPPPPKPPRAAKGKKAKVASAAAVEDINREIEQNSIQPSPSRIQQPFLSTASIANSETVVSTSTANDKFVDDDAGLDSLFEGNPDEIEDVASLPVPPIPDGAKEETVEEMAAQMEAELEAGLLEG